MLSPVYFAALDNFVEARCQRFDQDGYRQYKSHEDLLLKECKDHNVTLGKAAGAELYKDDPGFPP